MKLIAEEGWSGEPTPVAVKSMDVSSAELLFHHLKGEATTLSLYFSTLRSDVEPEVFQYPPSAGGEAVPGLVVELTERRQWPPSLVLEPDDMYHASITIPEHVATGLYLLSLGGSEPFTLLDTSSGRAALCCPDGVWSVSGTPIRRAGEGGEGRTGEGIPMFFRVPADLEKLEVFMTVPARIRREDGSVVLEMADTKASMFGVCILSFPWHPTRAARRVSETTTSMFGLSVTGRSLRFWCTGSPHPKSTPHGQPCSAASPRTLPRQPRCPSTEAWIACESAASPAFPLGRSCGS